MNRNARAGFVLVALALVGGTGCITMSVMSEVRQQREVRQMEESRQQRIAQRESAVQAGDPAAMVAQAGDLLSAANAEQRDPSRAVALLSDAAAHGYGPAQAILGELLATGRSSFGIGTVLPPTQRDRARGIELLSQAATRACTFLTPLPDRRMQHHVAPAYRLSVVLADHNEPGPWKLWRARSILHCGLPSPDALASPARPDAMALAWLLLTKDEARIGTMKTKMNAADIAAGEREAADLRRLVAESEQRYPAPPREKIR
ncbi:hypothetical protein IP92_00023 [Pseudoduganella flava]|uniref:Lipoprotein n=1 Tax=Pseudoduganella flava TaxID=871742 RepID=A0A562Q2X0_9BURK|nr:hypothetical protein [Pseudoduganella flava]QGZ41117.1 hypothetical protein GO485_20030 [Pseudoduganella flava]TWI51041.1 hypothetical protein IP92_00023 [Pseudoduganella flava]